jgi:phytoene dehydrogenase-like protein
MQEAHSRQAAALHARQHHCGPTFSLHLHRYHNYRDSFKAAGGDNFVPGGMYQIINKLAQGQDIRLNRTVTRIRWNGTQVQVGGCGA